LGLKVPDIYCIPCECSKAFVRQTGRTFETRFKEHMGHTYLGHPEKSVVADHSIEAGHRIGFDVSILARVTGYTDCITEEAIEI